MQNFQDIITFREAYPEQVVLLTGNHDSSDRHFIVILIDKERNIVETVYALRGVLIRKVLSS